MRLAFGDCVFDSDTRQLLRGGKARSIPPKAFELLKVLLESRPRALSQAEIRDRLWPRSVVARSSLGRLMAQLRAAIGDDARRPALVRTVQRFGYAFCGSVHLERAAGAQPSLDASFRLLWGSREIALQPGENLVGRTASCAVRIDAPGVSRTHARILVESGRAVLEDLGSKNGTFLGGGRLERPVSLADGDEIALGSAVLAVRILRPDQSTETVPGR
jgi:DNA-binding winged helix-turn-helix (wHTH) protein